MLLLVLITAYTVAFEMVFDVLLETDIRKLRGVSPMSYFTCKAISWQFSASYQFWHFFKDTGTAVVFQGEQTIAVCYALLKTREIYTRHD